MEEFALKTSERIIMAIQQFLEKYDELPEELEGTFLEEEYTENKFDQLEEQMEVGGIILEEEQAENKVQETEEIFDFESFWAIFERKLDEWFQDSMGNPDQLEEQMEGESADASLQLNGDLNDLKDQFGKIYNIDFWGLRQIQLTRAIAVHRSKKIQNGGLQTEAWNLFLNLLLSLTRQRKRGAIVKKGMG